MRFQQHIRDLLVNAGLVRPTHALPKVIGSMPAGLQYAILEAEARAWRAWAAGHEAGALQEKAEYEAKAAQAQAWEAEAEAFAEAAKASKKRGAAWKMKARREEARRKWAAETEEYLREHAVPITRSRSTHACAKAKQMRERARYLEAAQEGGGGRIHLRIHRFLGGKAKWVWMTVEEVQEQERMARQLTETGFLTPGPFARNVADEAGFRAGILIWDYSEGKYKEDAQAWEKLVQEFQAEGNKGMKKKAQEYQEYAEAEAAREGITEAEAEAWERAAQARIAEAQAWEAHAEAWVEERQVYRQAWEAEKAAREGA